MQNNEEGALRAPVMDGERTGLHWATATEAARALADGSIGAEELVRACLQRIEQTEHAVGAWEHLDPEHAIAQARAADGRRAAGEPLGPLHGVPVAVKDIIDTADMPTACGSPLYAGRQPLRDAAVVARLRAAGAVILGKTVTTEFAYFTPGKTRNPHDTRHTPGGSSSGSAAAVAAAMVPLALATQTNGSVIRPASFCGIVGFKPTRGLIPRTGILSLSRTLDQVGTYARSVEDVALLAQVLAGHDDGDPDTRPRALPAFAAVASAQPPATPRLAFVRTPMWDRTEPDTRAAFEELREVLGKHCAEVEQPESAREALDWHRTIMEAEMAFNLRLEHARAPDALSDRLRELLERGRGVSAFDYQRACGTIEALNSAYDDFFIREFDAILTPAATGPAPRGTASTGDPVFCSTWTLTGMPSITLPLLQGENGLPIGVQLVGRRGGDAQLLRTARWLSAWVAEAEPATMD